MLECFVAHCASKHLGYSAIKLYLCAVRHEYILTGFGDIVKGKPRLELTLKGIKRATAKPKRPRLPITTSVMYALYDVLAAGFEDTYTDIMLWAAACLGFIAGLRSGEFIVNGIFDPDTHMCLGDISFHMDTQVGREVMHIVLRSSKTDPFREGCTLLLYATGHRLCPVVAMKAYLAKRVSPNLSSPLFITSHGYPLTRPLFICLLHRVLKRAGFNPAMYNGHSFRRGFATSASAAGVPDHVLMSLGRWKSSCYKLYIDTAHSVVASAHLALADPELCNKL